MLRSFPLTETVESFSLLFIMPFALEVSGDEVPILPLTFFMTFSDVLTGYLGYHSWDVTLGQVLSSDYYMVNIVLAQVIQDRC